jgi:hypothetical protein
MCKKARQSVEKNMSVSAFGVDHGGISKADKKSSGNPSVGRMAAGGLLYPFHAAAAGRKGKKLRAVGNQVGGAALGALPGAALMGAGVATKKPGMVFGGHYLGGAGGVAGAVAGTRRANRKGYFKPEENQN